MSENQEHKTWTMLRRAIPPIVPTRPATDSGIGDRLSYDAQWNSSTGHDKNATQWQYIAGNGGGSSPVYCNLAITNGIWIDKNYLQFEGAGKALPTNQKEFAPNNADELYVLDGIGQVYYKTISGDIRSLIIYENKVEYRYKYYYTTINMAGKDARMVYACSGRLVVYDKNGKRYHAFNSNARLSGGGRANVDSVTYFNGFVGRVYSMKTRLSYDGRVDVTNNGTNFVGLDKEWAYVKNRFRL